MEHSIALYSTEIWNLREKDIDYGIDRRTHYTPGVLTAAMKAFIQLGEKFENTIYTICSDLMSSEEDWYVNWVDTLAHNLWGSFLEDNLKFNSPLVLERYLSRPFDFFTILQSILDMSKDIDYESHLDSIVKNKRDIGVSFSVNDIHPGWAAIIREFGIFRPMDSKLNSSCYSYRTWCNQNHLSSLPPSFITDLWSEKFSVDKFTSYTLPGPESRRIICPAHKLMATVGLNAMLNTALVFQDVFDESNFISLISLENKSFRDNLEMIDEYRNHVSD